jgi:putative membrane protein
MNPFAYGFGGVMMIFPMILWILLIVLIVKLFQDKNSSTSPKETNNKALDILKERFAKGEIDEEEFLRKKELLDK